MTRRQQQIQKITNWISQSARVADSEAARRGTASLSRLSTPTLDILATAIDNTTLDTLAAGIDKEAR